MANHIGGLVTVGAPHSIARYKNATTICVDCLDSAPENFTIHALVVGVTPVIVQGQCYVCEKNADVAFVASQVEKQK